MAAYPRDDQMKWYHGRLTREAADDLLKQGAYQEEKTTCLCVCRRLAPIVRKFNLFILLIVTGYEDGTFLVRESSTAAGDFVLSLLYQVNDARQQTKTNISCTT